MRDDLVEWLREIGSRAPAIGQLLNKSEADQRAAGYFHTLREICQQPITWEETAGLTVRAEAGLRAMIEGSPDSGGPARMIVLTGSGSSGYAGECLAPALQRELQLPVACVTGGAFLTHGAAAAPPCHPSLVVSLARSGDSPESCATVDILLRGDTPHRHLIVTCNRHGKLACDNANLPGVLVLVLADRTNDRSLVMTSSFTNLALAARFLGMLGRSDEYRSVAARLGKVAREVLLLHAQPLADLAGREIRLMVFLGSGCAHGAAREAALKMLEMSGGRVKTLAETFLGLRHGPMAMVHAGALVVCYLSSTDPARAYELDLLRELDRKELGVNKIIVGCGIPAEILQPGDLAVECPGLFEVGDSNAYLIHVLVGQILSFFQCLHLGLQPDNPSAGGVISRVVGPFPVYY